MTGFDTQVSFWTLAIARVFQAVGLAFLFVPINTVAYAGLPPGKSNNASALINLMRNLGGSVGISVANTICSNAAPISSGSSGVASDAVRLAVRAKDSSTPPSPDATSATPSVAPSQALGSIYRTLTNQATMLSYIDVFRILAIGSLLAIGLAFFLRKVEPGKKVAAGHRNRILASGVFNPAASRAISLDTKIMLILLTNDDGILAPGLRGDVSGADEARRSAGGRAGHGAERDRPWHHRRHADPDRPG